MFCALIINAYFLEIFRKNYSTEKTYISSDYFPGCIRNMCHPLNSIISITISFISPLYLIFLRNHFIFFVVSLTFQKVMHRALIHSSSTVVRANTSKNKRSGENWNRHRLVPQPITNPSNPYTEHTDFPSVDRPPIDSPVDQAN